MFLNKKKIIFKSVLLFVFSIYIYISFTMISNFSLEAEEKLKIITELNSIIEDQINQAEMIPKTSSTSLFTSAFVFGLIVGSTYLVCITFFQN